MSQRIEEVVRNRIVRRAGLLFTLSVLFCCSTEVSTDTPEVALTTSALGTYDIFKENASESVLIAPHMTSNDLVFTVAYNDSDPSYVTYNNSSRQVYANASLMGYRAGSMNVLGGNGDPQKLRPPTGWSVLWSDPGITANQGDLSRAYITNLAVPSSKFPSSGVIDGSMAPTGLPASYCGSYIGGACIARSTNGGATFTLAAADCVKRTSTACPNGTFYDGSDMTASPNGQVYAAYNDVYRKRIDVYMATSKDGSFARVTDFDTQIDGHPRLRFGPNGMYLMGRKGSTLLLTRYPSGTSRTGAWTAPVTVGTSVEPQGGTITFANNRIVRYGEQFSFDVGKNESGTSEIRVLYTTTDSTGKRLLKGAKCTTGSTISCSAVSVWSTASSKSDQWNPVVAYGEDGTTRWWAHSFHTRQRYDAGSYVEIWAGQMTNTSFSAFVQEPGQMPCSDLRGYWGDYDNLSYSPPNKYFMRGLTDSTRTTCVPENFRGTPQDVSTSLFKF